MIFTRLLCAALLATTLPVAVLAQAPMPNPEAARGDQAARIAAALDRLSYRPDAYGVAGIESQLAAAPDVSPETKAKAKALRMQAVEARNAGKLGEAARVLYQAISVLRGTDWANDAFGSSVTLELSTPVADRGDPLFATVRGIWPELPANKEMSLAVRVVEDRPDGKQVADLHSHRIYGTDFVAAPQRVVLTISNIAPGHYRLESTLSSDGKAIARFRSSLDIIDGVHLRAAELRDRLDKITGHDDAKATIRYPFSLYRSVNAGQREVLSYNYQAQIDRSMAMMAQLEAGNDPVLRGKGDQKRAHLFAGEVVPYRLYVPKSWDGKAALPLVVFLHGANLDDDNSMDRAGGLLPKLAEERGVIVLAPLGYRMNSVYGATLPDESADFGLITTPDPLRRQRSEDEVLNVTDLVAKEYGVDPKRIYLMGNSMGGMGTWHLGAKYPERWAAIAPAAGGVNGDVFDYARLKPVPIMAVAGELDGVRPMVEATVAKAKAAGVKPIYKFVPGGTHGTAIEMAMPEVFDFFAKHHKK